MSTCGHNKPFCFQCDTPQRISGSPNVILDTLSCVCSIHGISNELSGQTHDAKSLQDNACLTDYIVSTTIEKDTANPALQHWHQAEDGFAVNVLEECASIF